MEGEEDILTAGGKPGHQPSSSQFRYSEGEEVEERLHTILKQVRDVSTSSDELRRFITDWSTEYHLSAERHNLLRPFAFRPTDSILELGCGCGAITRQLGESGAEVVAVEGSPRRASIARERCRDLSNVNVICSTISDFTTKEKFDSVMLIGVLEYARVFISGRDPVLECLRRAFGYLKGKGALFLAIENQLGLKYFNGCNEDHMSVPYFGIHDLYRQDTPVTFGKRDLTQYLQKAGFDDIQFFYPFPDYKVPNLILSEKAFEDPGFNLGALLLRSGARDYTGNAYRTFYENLAWSVLERNGLVGDLANSFLVVARQDKGETDHTVWLAKSYSTARVFALATENSFLKQGSDILVQKKYVLDNNRPKKFSTDGLTLTHHVHDGKYIPGKLYAQELIPRLARGGTLEDIVQWAVPWVEFLKSKAVHSEGDPQRSELTSLRLPGDHIDCIPSNLIKNASGEFLYFDAEWRSDRPVPMSWITARGIIYSLILCLKQSRLENLTYRELTQGVLEELGFSLREEDYQEIERLENALQAICLIQAESQEKTFFSNLLNQGCGSYSSVFHVLAQLENQRSELRTEVGKLSTQVGTLEGQVSQMTVLLAERDRRIDELLRSLSWRITSPLRKLYEVCRRLASRSS